MGNNPSLCRTTLCIIFLTFTPQIPMSSPKPKMILHNSTCSLVEGSMRLGRKLIYPAYANNPQSTGELNELHKTLTIVSIRKLKKKKITKYQMWINTKLKWPTQIFKQSYSPCSPLFCLWLALSSHGPGSKSGQFNTVINIYFLWGPLSSLPGLLFCDSV